MGASVSKNNSESKKVNKKKKRKSTKSKRKNQKNNNKKTRSKVDQNHQINGRGGSRNDDIVWKVFLFVYYLIFSISYCGTNSWQVVFITVKWEHTTEVWAYLLLPKVQ